MRRPALALLFPILWLPAAAAGANYRVDFLINGGQSCAFNICTDVAAGEIQSATFSLGQAQLDLGGLIDIGISSSFPNVVPVPATGTGTAAFAAIVANQTVEDILIGVEWVNFILDFGNTYSFIATNGEWAHTSTTTGGPLNIQFNRFGTYAIEQVVPKPAAAILILSGLALCWLKRRTG